MSLSDVRDKVAVITGASRGLGAGIAQAFFRHGMRLGLCSQSEPVLASEERVIARRLDVADPVAVDAFAHAVAAAFGHIDLWINNAGILEPVTFVRDVAPEEFARHLAVNVGGVLNGSRAFLRHLHATGRPGVLINISSGAAQKGYAGWGAYCAGKAAVDRLSECIALEEQDRPIRVHAVAPGVIDTRMQETIRSMTPDRFPMVGKFLELAERDAFNTPAFVAEELLALAFDPARQRDEVVLRLPQEKRAPR